MMGMQWICHDWSDAECVKVLRNCYWAVPDNINGKVIIAENILPEDPNQEAAVSGSIGDVIMLTVNPGGRERTEKEFHALAEQAGFKRLIKVCVAFNIWIIELYKSN